MGTSRNRQGILRQALVTLVVAAAGLVVVAGPASAASLRNTPTDCPVAELRGDSIFVVEPTADELPAVLRDLGYDCAFDVDGVSDETPDAAQGRVFVLQEPTFDDVMDSIRAVATSSSWNVTRTAFALGEEPDLEGVLARDDLDGDITVRFERRLDERLGQTLDFQYVDSATTTLQSPSFSAGDAADEGLTLDPARGSYLSVTLMSMGDVSDASFAEKVSFLPWAVAFLLSTLVAVGGVVAARRRGAA